MDETTGDGGLRSPLLNAAADQHDLPGPAQRAFQQLEGFGSVPQRSRLPPSAAATGSTINVLNTSSEALAAVAPKTYRVVHPATVRVGPSLDSAIVGDARVGVLPMSSNVLTAPQRPLIHQAGQVRARRRCHRLYL